MTHPISNRIEEYPAYYEKGRSFVSHLDEIHSFDLTTVKELLKKSVPQAETHNAISIPF